MLDIRKASPKIGAEIKDVDVRTMTEETFDDVYQAFLDHIVIVIRDQPLTEQ